MISLRQIRLETTTQFAAGEEHAPLTLQTFKPDIGSQAYNFPFISSAGMGLAQTNYIVQA
jgi:hypothetical protein